MEILGDTGRRHTSRISFLGQSLLTLAVLGVVAAFIVTQSEPEADPDAEERPFDQASQGNRVAPVWSLAFSPSGTRLAFATITGDVWLKDLATERSVLLQRGPVASARSVAFSPDSGTLAVAGGEPRIRLWDVEAEKELASLEVGGEPTTCVAFSTAGERLAVGQAGDAKEQGAVTIWDWARRRRLATLDGIPGRVTTLTFAPDGAELAAGGSVGLVTLWDATSGQVRARFQTPEPKVGSTVALAFSPAGTLLARAGLHDYIVRLWDAASGEPRGTIPVRNPSLRPLAFSPAGTILALENDDGTTALWDVATGRELGVFGIEGRPLHSLAFSHDGLRLATGSDDGAVRLWDISEALAGKEQVRGPSTGERSDRSL